MVDTTDTMQKDYPLPVYRFKCSVGGEDMNFSEVSGLDMGNDPITYKSGLQVQHMPGQSTDVNITFKRGILMEKSELYKWIKETSLNLINKKDMTVSLTTADAGTLLVTWTIAGAFPKLLTGPSINAASNEVSIETLAMRADSVVISSWD